MIIQFLTVFKDYLVEILPALAAGFLLSGLIHEFIPVGLVERYLGGRGIRPLIYSTLVGTALPVCCMGSLPIAISLSRKGARLGPVMAFLVATPATSIPALLVCYSLLGIRFTLFIFFAVILMGLVMGMIGNLVRLKPESLPNHPHGQGMVFAYDPICGMSVDTKKAMRFEYNNVTYHFCCPHCKDTFEEAPERYAGKYRKGIRERINAAFRFGCVDMVIETCPELLVGLVLAAVVAVIVPVRNFVGDYLGGITGYLFSVVFGLIMYICSTAGIPLVDSLISQGMTAGAGMTLLIVGPVANWGTILILRKEFGTGIMLVYIGSVSVISPVLGYCFSTLCH